MSDERRFTIWRCPLGHLSEAPTHGLCSAIGEPIEVVEVDALTAEAERDALRAQVEALMRHIHVGLHRAAVPMSNCRMCGALAAARDAAAPCTTCDGTGRQKDDRNCDCLVPAFEGAGQHSPGCACFKPCPCGAARDAAKSEDA